MPAGIAGVLLAYKLRDEWDLDNWGAHVFPDCIEIAIDSENAEKTCAFEFYSIEVPPLKAIEKISFDFPVLLFEIEFCGLDSGFMGVYTYREGVLVYTKPVEEDDANGFFDDVFDDDCFTDHETV